MILNPKYIVLMINVHRFKTFLKQKIENKINKELSQTLQDNSH